MKLCQTQTAHALLFLFAVFVAAVPAFAQEGNAQQGDAPRGNLGFDAGEMSDRFGNLTRSNDPGGDVYGEVVVLRSSGKESWPDVLAGGDFRFPSDTNHHAKEFAFYGGLGFHATSSLTVGFHVQIHKLYVPPSTVDNQVFNRYNMELLELPLFVEYKFGPAKHVFVRADGAPEFRPHFKIASTGASSLPNPDFDHGYFLRGSLGYNFGKWYVKAGYETRYFKFTPNVGNPNGMNNWRTDFATAGVGLNF